MPRGETTSDAEAAPAPPLRDPRPPARDADAAAAAAALRADAWAWTALVAGKAGTALQLVITRGNLKYWLPQVLMPLRALIAAPCLWAIALALEGPPPGRPLRAQAARVLAGGVLGIFAAQSLGYIGLTFAPATNYSLIVQLVPSWVVLMGAVAGVERLTPLKALGVGLAAAGAGLLVGSHGHLGTGARALIGDGCFLAVSLLAAALLVLKKGLLVSGLPPFGLMASLESVAALIGTAVAVPFYLPAQLARPMPWPAVAAAAAVAVITCVDAMLILYALRRLPPTAVAVTHTLLPPVTAGLSYLLLGEPLHWTDLLFGPLILAGVALVIWQRHLEARSKAAPMAASAGTATAAGVEGVEGTGLREPLLGPGAADQEAGPAAENGCGGPDARVSVPGAPPPQAPPPGPRHGSPPPRLAAAAGPALAKLAAAVQLGLPVGPD